jgi:hypothetical protein
MASSLLSYAEWTTKHLEPIHRSEYEVLWDNAQEHLQYFGRYAIIKVLETLYRGNVTDNSMPDIRPEGAWSPRLTLAWLYPDDATVIIEGKNSPKTIELINQRVDNLRKVMNKHMGYDVSYFQVEVLLCNYRQVLDERNGRYAGWSHDADLAYHTKVNEYFGELDFKFFEHRKNKFPNEFLGEIQGWNEPRKEIYGYRGFFWSDKLYSYHDTEDFYNPVKR